MSDLETINKYFDCNWGCGCPKRHCPDGKPCQRCRIAALEARVREVESDLAAARVTIGELLAGLSKIADHGKGKTDEQIHLRIYAATYYRWAKDEAAALVARHQAQQ